MKKQAYHESDYTVPSYQTFPEFLDGMEKLYADRPALSAYTRRQEELHCTYRELTGRVRALREALCAQRFAGKCIAIISENSFEWILVFLASVSCGSTVLCVDTEQPDEGIRDMIRRGQPAAVFLSPSFLPICAPAEAERGGETLVLMNGDTNSPDVTALQALLSLGQERLSSGLDSAGSITVRPDQTAEIIFTSGTTSRSKMVMLSQQAVLQNMSDTGPYVHLDEEVFTSLPFYHAYGLNCGVLCSLLRGDHLTINGNLKTSLRDFQLSQAGTMFAVPLIVETLHNQLWLNAERAGKADALRRLLRSCARGRKLGVRVARGTVEEVHNKLFGKLDLIICGGAHLDQEIIEEFDLLGVQVLQGYGISECSPLVSVNCNYANKIGSVGRPMPSVEVRIVSDEIWVRGVSVMQGYYNAPEQTAEVMEDGWFKTGDLGYLDKDGYLYLTGRGKNLIVFKNGKKVSPERLENLLLRIPLVKEVMVYGAVNGSSADDVKLTASVFPDPERTAGMTAYEVLDLLQKEVDQVNAELPAYQQIHMITVREKEFAKTGTKKIKRYSEV